MLVIFFVLACLTLWQIKSKIRFRSSLALALCCSILLSQFYLATPAMASSRADLLLDLKFDDYNYYSRYNVTDSSQYGNNGQIGTRGSRRISGGPNYTSPQDNRLGSGAVSFHRSDNPFIEIPTQSRYGRNILLQEFTDDNFTLEAWVRTSQGGGGTIINNQYNNYSRGVNLKIVNKKVFLSVGDRWGSSNSKVAAIRTFNDAIPQDDQWHHLVASKKGKYAGHYKIYVDGRLELTEILQDNLNNWTVGSNDPLDIGVSHGSSDYFQGTLDEIRVYQRELTAEEVQARYQREEIELNKGLDEDKGDKHPGPIVDNVHFYILVEPNNSTEYTSTIDTRDGAKELFVTINMRSEELSINSIKANFFDNEKNLQASSISTSVKKDSNGFIRANILVPITKHDKVTDTWFLNIESTDSNGDVYKKSYEELKALDIRSEITLLGEVPPPPLEVVDQIETQNLKEDGAVFVRDLVQEPIFISNVGNKTLNYTVISGNANVAKVSLLEEKIIAVYPLDEGQAHITVIASDIEANKVSQEFLVNVEASSIELRDLETKLYETETGKRTLVLYPSFSSSAAPISSVLGAIKSPSGKVITSLHRSHCPIEITFPDNLEKHFLGFEIDQSVNAEEGPWEIEIIAIDELANSNKINAAEIDKANLPNTVNIWGADTNLTIGESPDFTNNCGSNDNADDPDNEDNNGNSGGDNESEGNNGDEENNDEPDDDGSDNGGEQSNETLIDLGFRDTIEINDLDPQSNSVLVKMDVNSTQNQLRRVDLRFADASDNERAKATINIQANGQTNTLHLNLLNNNDANQLRTDIPVSSEAEQEEWYLTVDLADDTGVLNSYSPQKLEKLNMSNALIVTNKVQELPIPAVNTRVLGNEVHVGSDFHIHTLGHLYDSKQDRICNKEKERSNVYLDRIIERNKIAGFGNRYTFHSTSDHIGDSDHHTFSSARPTMCFRTGRKTLSSGLNMLRDVVTDYNARFNKSMFATGWEFTPPNNTITGCKEKGAAHMLVLFADENSSLSSRGISRSELFQLFDSKEISNLVAIESNDDALLAFAHPKKPSNGSGDKTVRIMNNDILANCYGLSGEKKINRKNRFIGTEFKVGASDEIEDSDNDDDNNNDFTTKQSGFRRHENFYNLVLQSGYNIMPMINSDSHSDKRTMRNKNLTTMGPGEKLTVDEIADDIIPNHKLVKAIIGHTNVITFKDSASPKDKIDVNDVYKALKSRRGYITYKNGLNIVTLTNENQHMGSVVDFSKINQVSFYIKDSDDPELITQERIDTVSEITRRYNVYAVYASANEPETVQVEDFTKEDGPITNIEVQNGRVKYTYNLNPSINYQFLYFKVVAKPGQANDILDINPPHKVGERMTALYKDNLGKEIVAITAAYLRDDGTNSGNGGDNGGNENPDGGGGEDPDGDDEDPDNGGGDNNGDNEDPDQGDNNGGNNGNNARETLINAIEATKNKLVDDIKADLINSQVKTDIGTAKSNIDLAIKDLNNALVKTDSLWKKISRKKNAAKATERLGEAKVSITNARTDIANAKVDFMGSIEAKDDEENTKAYKILKQLEQDIQYLLDGNKPEDDETDKDKIANDNIKAIKDAISEAQKDNANNDIKYSEVDSKLALMEGFLNKALDTVNQLIDDIGRLDNADTKLDETNGALKKIADMQAKAPLTITKAEIDNLDADIEANDGAKTELNTAKNSVKTSSIDSILRNLNEAEARIKAVERRVPAK